MTIETKVAPAVEPEIVADAVEDAPEKEAVAAEVAASLPAVVTDEERALAERSRALAPNTTLPSPGEWEAMLAVASKVAGTKFVPGALRGSPEAVLAAIMYGRELGLAPMQSLQKIHMIDGRPSMSADMMLAKLRMGGIVILESVSTAERAWIKARRSDTGEVAEVEWTIEDARAAGLLSKDNWRGYAIDMLWARCVGRLARRLGSDLVAGMVYAAEEMAEWDDGGYGGNVTSGRASGSEPVVEFDVSRRAVDGAPTGGWKEIMGLLAQVDPSLDWPLILQDACEALYRTRAIVDLSPDDHKAFGIRSANMAARMRDASEGDWPPDTEKAQEILAWAYDGNVIELHPKRQEATGAAETGEAAESPQQALDAQEEPAGAATDDAELVDGEVVDHPQLVDPEELPDFGGSS